MDRANGTAKQATTAAAERQGDLRAHLSMMRRVGVLAVTGLSLSALIGCETAPAKGEETAASAVEPHLPIGQSVECFAFDDGFTNPVGPTQAIYFSPTGQACVPDGSPAGACRKWWGECRTTDASHTPVQFRVMYVGPFTLWRWSDRAGAIYGYHTPGDWLLGQPDTPWACIPDGTPSGECGTVFGNATTDGGRPVRCRLFNDNNTSPTAYTSVMRDAINSTVWGRDLGGTSQNRKWFGECIVGACGDGVCDHNEDPNNCRADCSTCGNGRCDAGESASSCPGDCFSCGDGTCNPGETPQNCSSDCKPACGDQRCSLGAGESCNTCREDCGPCQNETTCSGARATSTARVFAVVASSLYSGCLEELVFYANDQREAQECAERLGATVVPNPDARWFTFNTGSRNGCASLSIIHVDEESAARCARNQGYPEFGDCP